MKNRTLGPHKIDISAIGLARMGMSEFYGKADDRQSLATLERAVWQ